MNTPGHNTPRLAAFAPDIQDPKQQGEHTVNYSTRFARTNVQLRLIPLADIDTYVFVDELAGFSLTDVKAFALDPDVTVRRLAALSNWNLDANLQCTLCTDPDESVVLTLLSRIDPSVEMCDLIIAGPHVDARRDLARRNLMTDILQRLADDSDRITAEMARATLVSRGVAVRSDDQDEQ